MASRFEALAPELRVQILEHVVRAERPLRNWATCGGKTPEAPPITKHFDAAILRSSKQIYEAAIVALHEVNSIVIPVPLHTWHGDRSLLQRCPDIILEFAAMTAEPEDVRKTVEGFRQMFPHASGTTIRLHDSPFTGGLLFSCLEGLVLAGFDNIRFEEVGVLRAEDDSSPKQAFELTLFSPYLLDRWEYFRNLPLAHADLRRNGTHLASETQVTDAMRRNPASVDYRQRIIRLGIVTLLERLRTRDRSGELEALKNFQRRYPVFEDCDLDSFAYQTAWINWLRGVFIPDNATL